MSDTGDTSVGTAVTEADSQASQKDQQTTEGADATQTQSTPEELAEVKATASRMKQEVEKYAKVMKGLGIDPDSDFAEKFNQGLVTQEELYERLNVSAPPVATQPQVAETPAQKLDKLMRRVDAEGASEDDFKEAVGTFKEYIESQEQTRAMSNQELLAQQCEKTVVDQLLADPIHKEMPSDELKTIEQRLFLSSTDALVGQEARRTPNPEKYLNPQTYQFYAEKNAQDLNKLRDHYEKRGFDKGVAAARGQTTEVTPISPSAGSTPVIPQGQRIDINNMSSMARDYLSKVGKPV